MSKKKELTPKQKRFCREYLKDFNGTQAVLRAGYKTKNPGDIASRLVSKSQIQAQIQKQSAKIEERENENVLEERAKIKAELKKLAYSDITKYRVRFEKKKVVDKDGIEHIESYVTVKTLDENGNEIDGETAAIQEISLMKTGFRFKTHDKKGSLELLAKMYGLLSDESVKVIQQMTNTTNLTGSGIDWSQFSKSEIMEMIKSRGKLPDNE